jgi:lysosomal acid lipase/cholesteryl ester hydrolase
VEEHTVVTNDGYILSLHRIPGSPNELPNDIENERKPPVLLGHCLLGSSAIWSFHPENSLAYQLADEGKLTGFNLFA